MISKDTIRDALLEYGISEFAVMPVSDAVFLRGKQLPDKYKTCIMFLIPYNTGLKINDTYNMGRFARSLDYHAFAKEVDGYLIAKLKEASGNEEEFASFCDSSPTDEKETAVKAGLGSKGKNSLLINKKYGSYCFISEIFTTADIETSFAGSGGRVCSDCMLCAAACPVGAVSENGFEREKCLSHISQKKKKTEKELELLREHKTVWGCDICQQACPANKNAELSGIEYFSRGFIADLTPETIKDMSDEEYEKRSFSYRKREVIEENF